MAEFLSPEEAAEHWTQRGQGRPNKYPWDDWFNSGKSVKCIRGDDYEIDTNAFRVSAHSAAHRSNGTVDTRAWKEDGKEGLILTFHPNTYGHGNGGIELPVDEPPDTYLDPEERARELVREHAFGAGPLGPKFGTGQKKNIDPNMLGEVQEPQES